MGRLILALALVLALAGCGHMFDTMPPVKGEGDHGYGTPEELGTLLERRDAEQVIADRDRMIGEISTALADIVPGARWLPHGEPHSSVCGDFGSTDGSIYFSPHYVSKVPVPAALWDEASRTVIDIAAKFGYTDVVSRTENATDDVAKDLTIRDADNGRLAFGSMQASTMYVGTGCYLTAEQKQQAR
jgi:Lipoprotein confined to pathogenic Mycobacterium